MYYKIVSDGKIVDACSGLNYVRYQQKNGLWISTSDDNAGGIISSDGSKIYNLDGSECVSITEITEEEYETLRQELIENGILSTTEDNSGETEIDTETSGDTETVSKSKTLLMIEQLQEQVAELKVQNEKLMSCLLEMSEVVYA